MYGVDGNENKRKALAPRLQEKNKWLDDDWVVGIIERSTISIIMLTDKVAVEIIVCLKTAAIITLDKIDSDQH